MLWTRLTYLPSGGAVSDTEGFCLSCLDFDTACSLNDLLDFEFFRLLEKLSVCDWLGRRLNMASILVGSTVSDNPPQLQSMTLML